MDFPPLHVTLFGMMRRQRVCLPATAAPVGRPLRAAGHNIQTRGAHGP